MNPNDISQVLAMIKQELSNPDPELLKSFNQVSTAAQGLQGYNLELPAKFLFPYITTLLDSIPRRVGGFGSQPNWKAVTAINTIFQSLGVAEGKRGGTLDEQTSDYYAAYRFLGMDNYVTEQAWRAGGDQLNVRAIARLNLLKGVRMQENLLALGGNGTAVALAKPTAPTVADSATAGSLANTTKYDVVVVALTLEGLKAAGGPGTAVAATKIVQTLARSNAGPYGGTTTVNGGSSIVSDATTHQTGGAVTAVTASTPVVTGAVAYAWFIGPNGGNVTLAAITTINSVLLQTVGASTQKVADLTGAVNYSKNPLVYDGLLYQAWKAGSGANIVNMATGTPGVGTPLTGDGDGNVEEILEIFLSQWQRLKMGFDAMWCNAQEAKNITQKVLASPQAGSTTMRFVVGADGNQIVGGKFVSGLLNPFDPRGAREVPIKIDPEVPAGTILLEPFEVTYPGSNVATMREMDLRFDYFAVDWPKVQWSDEFGVYFDGVLKHYFPAAMAIITNIADG